MRKWIVGLLAVFGLMGGLVPAMAGEVTEIRAAGLHDMMAAGKVLVVFPLSRIEFNNLNIPGSVNIPLSKLASGLPADKEGAVAFYCLGST